MLYLFSSEAFSRVLYFVNEVDPIVWVQWFRSGSRSISAVSGRHGVGVYCDSDSARIPVDRELLAPCISVNKMCSTFVFTLIALVSRLIRT